MKKFIMRITIISILAIIVTGLTTLYLQINKITTHNKHLKNIINHNTQLKFNTKPKITNIFPPKVLIKNIEINTPNGTSKIAQAILQLNILDLLSGKITIKSITLDQLIGSYQELKNLLHNQTVTTDLTIRNSKIYHSDSKYIDQLYISIPKAQPNQAARINLTGNLQLNQLSIPIKTSLLIEKSPQQISLNNFHFTIEYPTPIKIKFNAIINKHNSLALKDFVLDFANIHSQGKATINLNDKTISGKINILNFNLHDTLASMQQPDIISNNAYNDINTVIELKNNIPTIYGTIDHKKINLNIQEQLLEILSPINLKDYAINLNKTNQKLIKYLINKMPYLKIKFKEFTDLPAIKTPQPATGLINNNPNNLTLTLTSNNYYKQTTINKTNLQTTTNLKLTTSNINPWLKAVFNYTLPQPTSGKLQINNTNNKTSGTIKIQHAFNANNLIIKFQKSTEDNLPINFQAQQKHLIISGKGWVKPKSQTVDITTKIYQQHPINPIKIATIKITGNTKKPTIVTSQHSIATNFNFLK